MAELIARAGKIWIYTASVLLVALIISIAIMAIKQHKNRNK